MKRSKSATLDYAKKLFGRGTDAFGPDEIQKVFGDCVKMVPEIPFSEEELRRARKLGQYLILQASVLKSGKPFTIKNMNHQFRNRMGGGRFLFDAKRYSRSGFYVNDTPTFGWKLVSCEVIPGSRGGNYVDQIQAIADYLILKVYEGQTLPPVYQLAIKEFDSRKAQLQKLLVGDSRACEEELTSLWLSKLFLQKPVEVMYGLFVQYTINGERSLSNESTWTCGRSLKNGRFVFVGYNNCAGVDILHDYPISSNPNLGICFSRGGVPNE